MRQDARRAETRRRLIEAATELFEARGVEAVSLEEVAARAGLVKGTVYYNFAGKDDLVLAAAGAALAEGQALLDRRSASSASDRRSASSASGRGADGDPLALIGAFLQGSARWAAASPRLAEAAARLAFLRGLQGKSTQGRASTRAALEPVVARAQRLGLLRKDLPAPVLTRALLLAWTAELLEWCATRAAPALPRRARRCVDLWLAGARSGP